MSEGQSEPRGVTDSIADTIKDFLRLETAGGLLLLVAAVLAMIIANSPLSQLYSGFLNLTVAVQVGALEINKPLFLWINDGLMAVFFFLIGLEIKREFLDGELSSMEQIVLPGMGALGGMLVPAGVYAALNWNDPTALDGWAIPVATDIAFALALLSVFGSRVPLPLKIFLLTLAIFDDLAAIVIIAIFYSGDISTLALMIAAGALAAAIVMNHKGVTEITPYLMIGLVLWIALLKSGVHATLAGVLLGFCIPLKGGEGRSPLRELEHDLHAPVVYVILPLFAFANAGLYFGAMSLGDLVHPVTLGIILGLVIGKPVGILIFVGLAVLLRMASLPRGTTWTQLTGIACACGIGFTMSLFIAGLAFEHGSGDYFDGDRLGIVVGSILSAALAYALLAISLPKPDGQKN